MFKQIHRGMQLACLALPIFGCSADDRVPPFHTWPPAYPLHLTPTFQRIQTNSPLAFTTSVTSRSVTWAADSVYGAEITDGLLLSPRKPEKFHVFAALTTAPSQETATVDAVSYWVRNFPGDIYFSRHLTDGFQIAGRVQDFIDNQRRYRAWTGRIDLEGRELFTQRLEALGDASFDHGWGQFLAGTADNTPLIASVDSSGRLTWAFKLKIGGNFTGISNGVFPVLDGVVFLGTTGGNRFSIRADSSGPATQATIMPPSGLEFRYSCTNPNGGGAVLLWSGSDSAGVQIVRNDGSVESVDFSVGTFRPFSCAFSQSSLYLAGDQGGAMAVARFEAETNSFSVFTGPVDGSLRFGLSHSDSGGVTFSGLSTTNRSYSLRFDNQTTVSYSGLSMWSAFYEQGFYTFQVLSDDVDGTLLKVNDATGISEIAWITPGFRASFYSVAESSGEFMLSSTMPTMSADLTQSLSAVVKESLPIVDDWASSTLLVPSQEFE